MERLLCGIVPVLSPGETVAELGVGELVEPARGSHAEISPHVLTATEVELLDSPRAWFESL